jgi:hypothetical protein
MTARSGESLKFCTMQAADMVASSSSTRIGVSYFINSFGFLTGPPISGALLGSQINWDKPIIFGGVCSIRSLIECANYPSRTGCCFCWINSSASARTDVAGQEKRNPVHLRLMYLFRLQLQPL